METDNVAMTAHPKKDLKRLWDHMSETHNLTLLESELVDIQHACDAENCETIRKLQNEHTRCEAELGAERNLHGQTRVVVEELNTICTDLRNAGLPQFIRSEAIRLLREEVADLHQRLAQWESAAAVLDSAAAFIIGQAAKNALAHGTPEQAKELQRIADAIAVGRRSAAPGLKPPA